LLLKGRAKCRWMNCIGEFDIPWFISLRFLMKHRTVCTSQYISMEERTDLTSVNQISKLALRRLKNTGRPNTTHPPSLLTAPAPPLIILAIHVVIKPIISDTYKTTSACFHNARRALEPYNRIYLFWEPAWMAQSGDNLYNRGGIYRSSHIIIRPILCPTSGLLCCWSDDVKLSTETIA